MNRKAKGAVAEQRAAEYLEKKGYAIVARNVVTGGVEVDIIALDGNCIVFAEVKSSYGVYPSPAENVTREKQRRYVRAAKAFVAERSLYNRDVRFDVIEVFDELVNHIEAAFDASCR